MSPAKSLQELSSRDVGKKDKLVVQKFDEEELPPGWKKEVKTRKGSNGKKRDWYYTDPVTGYVFRSLTDVQRYLRTGKLGRLAKKPKTTETDKTSVEAVESDEQTMVVSTPTTTDASPPPPLKLHSKSELPQRASKRLAGVTIDAPPPPPPPSSPPEPKTRKATRLSGVKIDAPPPPSPSPPPPSEPRTRQAKRQAGMEIDPPPITPPESKTPKATRLAGIQVEPPPPSSPPPEPKTSHQVAAKTRPTVVLAIPKEKNKKPETKKITNNDGIADMAAKPSITQKSLGKVNKSKAGENQESHTVLPPVRQKPPPPATVPPAEFAIPTSDSRQEKQELPGTNNPSQDSSINFCLNDFWTDPCIEFAVKTLTGAIPFGDLNKAGNFASSPLEVPMEELWTDPCIEFAVKTLTGAIPVGEDPGNGIQDYVHHQPEVLSKHKTGNSNNKKQLESVGNGGGLQKSGNIGFHQQVNGSNGQCSRSRFFQ